MAVIRCKMCGGDIELSADKTFGTCEYCGSVMTLPKIDDDQRAAAFNRGNHFRRIGEFDKALAVYERIVAEDNTDAEAHWCCALCRFGIEYVEDPATYEWYPTCHRASFDSILEDVDYLAALDYSDGITRRQYQKDGAKIAEVQRTILATSQKEEPFDVFICYKESEEDGSRTVDSTLAQDIYYQLTDKGYRVFFSRITLEDKAGSEYEPYIFAALNSAKVMVAVGTKPEHFSAVWVKNEWSRFLVLMRKDRGKLLLPCYRDMDPYDLPEQLSVLQSYDMSKIGFIQDLIRGVAKVLDAEKDSISTPKTVVIQSERNSNIDALLKRGNMALEDGEWEKADDFFEQVLNQDAECTNAYLGKAMAEMQIKNKEVFRDSYVNQHIGENRNIRRAKEFADANQMAWFEELEREKKEELERQKLKNEEIKRLEAERRIKMIQKYAEIRKKQKQVQGFISAGSNHTVGLHADGSVVAVGENEDGQCDVSNWKGIVAISAGVFYTAGLNVDGTVVATGDSKPEVSDWRNIIVIDTSKYNVIGLRGDGTVVVTGRMDGCDVSNWENIVAISAGRDHIEGLRGDGTVVVTGYKSILKKHHLFDVISWTDIVAISAEEFHIVGLRSDGTVVAAGQNIFGECSVSDWTDIVAISTGSRCTAGLRMDGSVVVAPPKRYDVTDWKNIVAVSAGHDHIVGLRSDGTVVAASGRRPSYPEKLNVSGWKLFRNYEYIEQEIGYMEQELINEFEQNKEQEIIKLNEVQEKRKASENELVNIRGLFSGPRKKRLESEITSLDEQIIQIKNQISEYEKKILTLKISHHIRSRKN